jgi:hypothetical protein
MSSKPKHFSIIHHSITRCGELLTDAEFRVFMCLYSWYNRKKGIGSFLESTLARGQKHQSELGWQDRGCGRKERRLRRILHALEALGLIKITHRATSARDRNTFTIDLGFFSRCEPRPLLATTPAPSDTQPRPLLTHNPGPSWQATPAPSGTRNMSEGADEKKPTTEETTTEETTAEVRVEKDTPLNSEVEGGKRVSILKPMTKKLTSLISHLNQMLIRNSIKQIQVEKVFSLIQLWNRRGFKFDKNVINRLEQVHIHKGIIFNVGDIFKIIRSAIYVQGRPGWIQILEDAKYKVDAEDAIAVGQKDAIELSTWAVELWLAKGMNRIHDNAGVVRTIHPNVKQMLMDMSIEDFKLLVETAWDKRTQTEFLQKLPIEWFFRQSKETEGGVRRFNIEKAAAGGFDTFTSKSGCGFSNLAAPQPMLTKERWDAAVARRVLLENQDNQVYQNSKLPARRIL